MSQDEESLEYLFPPLTSCISSVVLPVAGFDALLLWQQDVVSHTSVNIPFIKFSCFNLFECEFCSCCNYDFFFAVVVPIGNKKTW